MYWLLFSQLAIVKMFVYSMYFDLGEEVCKLEEMYIQICKLYFHARDRVLMSLVY